MITAQVMTGFVPVVGVCYPIVVTNGGVVAEEVSVVVSSNTIVTSSVFVVPPSESVTIYAVTRTLTDIVQFVGGNTVNLTVNCLEYSGPLYGEPSYIQAFELPGGQNEIIPTLENIDLLMRQGKYFPEPGVLKVWRPDSL